MSTSAVSDSAAGDRQQRLLRILACPRCRADLDVDVDIASQTDGYVFDADLRCRRCGVVGVITNGRPSFLVQDLSNPEVPRGVATEAIATTADQRCLVGAWAVDDRNLVAQEAGARICGVLHGVGVAFEVMAHPWSGRVVFELAGQHMSVDLYSTSHERRVIVLDGVADGEHTWSATVVAGGNDLRLGDQLVLREIRSLVPVARAQLPPLLPVNRGNAYPSRFDELLRTLPADAVVLDLGGGDRRHSDPRVLNMEYLPYDAVDFRADGLQLPIRDGSVDLILSQAVLEHVSDPPQAVAEMRRVVRAGGSVYAEIAFMQPLHAVPFHFFNVTPHGATLLFEDFDVIDQGCFGGLAETMAWMFGLVDAEQRLGQATTLSMIGDLVRLDAMLTEEQLAHVASAVFVEARVRSRPVAHVAQSTDAPVTSTASETALREPELPGEFFHRLNHELRTLELERVPKGARHALSVGPEGRWFFDWFERAVGGLEQHIGIEAFTPRPDDLPAYVSWIPDTADHMDGVPDESIDLVFGGQTSEHLWQDELVGFLLESHRVLRPNGQLVLDSPNRLITQHLQWSHGGHTIELSANEMTELLQLAGFAPAAATGVWNCVIDGRVLQLEEGLSDPTIVVRRVAQGRERPDDCFVWWINSRKLDVEPDIDGLTRRAEELFAEHWDTRVCRGLATGPRITVLPLDVYQEGVVASTLPFPLRSGHHTISIELAAGDWSQISGLRLDLIAPGDLLVQSLTLESAAVDGGRASWVFEQPWLLFAVMLEVRVGRVEGPAALRLPFRFARSASPLAGPVR